MRGMTSLLVVAIVSIGIAFGLSWLPQLESASRQQGKEEAVFQTEATRTLTDRNLVDLLVRQPLFMDIGHVEWSDSILSIDLKAKHGQADPDFIYRDLYTLSKLSLNGTRNVNQLLVRIMEQPSGGGGSQQLLVAMEARREDLKKAGAASGANGTTNAEQYVSSHFRLTFTPTWLDRRTK
ncbi:hypothetical protein [Paenibacillus sp. HJGM_3]|uniref:hypothetical protein n=1 Tax=Paenibacillus sp. HJGM_3 TaxID=3379816 RepID=UPI00385B061C